MLHTVMAFLPLAFLIVYALKTRKMADAMVLATLLAVLLVTEARHRLRSKAIPETFRGLPITLVYIGVLALAIYGFTGHSVIL